MAISRRHFLSQGSALVIGIRYGAMPVLAQVQPGAALPGALRNHPHVDAWLGIGPGDAVTLFTGKAELGQGLKTALVQLAAEELDVPAEWVEVVVADTQRTPNESYTSGSRSIQDSGMSIRHAAAEARRILLDAAASRLGVPAGTLRVEAGRVTAADGRALRYAELVGEGLLHQPVTGSAPLKARSDYRLVGRSLPRVDLPAKVFGHAPAFVHDLRLEGMLHARTVHPPTQQARLASVELAEVRRMAGVQHVLRDGSLLGVVATREEQAIAASAALAARAKWDNVSTEALPDETALPEFMRAQAVRRRSVATRGEGGGAPAHRASYFRPFQAHASMGPSCAVALFEDGRLTVWSHTQGIYPLRVELARVLALPEDAIRTISQEGPGCYGQNGADDAAVEAAILAMAVPGRPVRLQWSRADEFGWEPVGAAMLIDCEAALDGQGRISQWQSVVRGFPNTARPAFGGGEGANLLAAQLREAAMPTREMTNVGLNRNSEPLYDIPVLQVDEELIPVSPVRVSSLRTLGAYSNVFAIESFMDELALVAGADPLAFRLAHLKDARGRAVLEAVAEAAGWQRRGSLGPRQGMGMGYARYSSSSTYCAVIAQVTVGEDGATRAERIWAAADCGPVVNPDGVRNQIAGGAVQATSWTLLESLRLQHASQGVSNWHEYPILRFADAPVVEVVLIDRPDQPIVGPGEASLGPTAAALANAVFAASGARVRSIPLSPRKVREAASATS